MNKNVTVLTFKTEDAFIISIFDYYYYFKEILGRRVYYLCPKIYIM